MVFINTLPNIKMTRLTTILILLLIMNGCLMDEPTEVHHLVKNFNLAWWAEPRYQGLYENSDPNKYGGSTIISETIFAVGFNDDFIIAKQHPNKQEEISKRLFNRDSTRNYRLSNPADTIYISEEYSIFIRNGNYYHLSNGWNPPDSLFPYRNETKYHIIDIREYGLNKWNSREHTYEYKSESEFQLGRQKLGVPDNLNFTIIDEKLK